MITKIVSDAEPVATVGTAIDWVLENEEPLVLERDGQPQAVLMRFDEYEQFQRLKERERIRAAFTEYARQVEEYRRTHPLPPPKPPLSREKGEALWAELEALRMRVSARNTDLTDEEIEAIAVEVGREARRAWAAKLRAGAYGND